MTREAGTQSVVIEDLHFAYGTRQALCGVSLSMRSGRLTAVLGPNGAGKSTLVALLCGLIASERGRIEVGGVDLTRNATAALARMGIVFQQQTLDLDLSVDQNMAYYAALRGIAGAESRRRSEDWLSRMGLTGRGGEKVRSLNGGHRRRLEIARAMLCEPELLLLDEPTVGLDVSSRSALVEHVHRLCVESGITVVWATHLVDEVWAEDDLVVLHRGRVQASAPVPAVLAQTGAANVLGAFEMLTADPPGQSTTA